MKKKLIQWTCDFCSKIRVVDDPGSVPLTLPPGWAVIQTGGNLRHGCNECVDELKEAIHAKMTTVPN